MGVQEVAEELYGLAPEDFTAARNARVKEAKSAGDTELAGEIQGLRKPTVGAWLLNQLVRRQREEVEQLFELGAALRAAQGTLGAAELRALGEQRRQLTRAVAGQTARLGQEEGRKISAQVLTAVEETLRSAMVDPQAGAALATGLLVDTFSSTGLDQVDVNAVVAVASAVGGVAPGPPSGQRRAAAAKKSAREQRNEAAEKERNEAIAEVRRELQESEDALARAHEEAEAARRSAVEAGRRQEDLESELAEARRRVKDLQKRLDAAEEDADATRRTQIAATRAERAAIAAAERLQRRLDALVGEA